jgi:hypothetical protein
LTSQGGREKTHYSEDKDGLTLISLLTSFGKKKKILKVTRNVLSKPYRIFKKKNSICGLHVERGK